MNIVKRTIIQVAICIIIIIFYLVAVNTGGFKKLVCITDSVIADSSHIHRAEDIIFDFVDCYVLHNRQISW